MPWVEADLCKGCAICVKICPVEGAIEMKEGKAYIHNDICTRCRKCMEACPTDAIKPNSTNPALRGNRNSLRHGNDHHLADDDEFKNKYR